MKYLRKTVFLLICLLAFLEIFFLSPGEIETRLLDVPRKGQGNELLAEQIMEEFHLAETGENRGRWELWSEKAYGSQRSGDWNLDLVNAQILGRENSKYYLESKKGEVVSGESKLILKEEVLLESNFGYSFLTDEATYFSNEKLFQVPGEVEVQGQKGFKSEGLSLNAVGLKGDLLKNRIQLLDQIRASRKLKSGHTISIKSDSADIFGDKENLLFRDRVQIRYLNYLVTGRTARFVYDNKKSMIGSMIVKGNVKITGNEREGLANLLVVYFAEEKIVLKERPKLIQGTDELLGEKIVFLRGGEEIEVIGAKARIKKDDNL